MSNHSKRAKQFAALGGGALVAAPFFGSAVAHANSYTVSNTGDSGAGSLREAIELANANPGEDMITFDDGVTGTITLTDFLHVTDSVTLVGPGADLLTLDGNDSTRVFYLDGDEIIDVSISGVTIANGITDSTAQGGGGMLVFSVDLTLDAVHLEDNRADVSSGLGGGIFLYDSSLLVTNSEITGNSAFGHGGGVYFQTASGPVIIRDTLISGNSAEMSTGGLYLQTDVPIELTRVRFIDNSSEGGAGALYFTGGGDEPITITDCTFAGNEAADGPGGAIKFDSDGASSVTISGSTFSGNVAVDGRGGAVYFDDVNADVSINTSTFSGNTSAYGGAIYINALYGDAGGTFTVAHTTITGNVATHAGNYAGGGGIYLYSDSTPGAGSVVLDHSVVAGNSAPDAALGGPDIHFSGGGFIGNWSMIGDLDGRSITGANNLPEGDPMLGALADNGGLTMTHLPLAGSPLLNAGNPLFAAPPSTDQRGQARVGYGRIDVGAVELNPAPVIPPTGSASGLLTGMGAALLALGGAMHLGGRRRTQQS